MAHPNASVAAVSGAITTLVVWIAGNWVDVPPEVAAAITTCVAALLLLAGRKRRV